MVLEFRQFLSTLLIVLLVAQKGSSFSTLKPKLSITKLQANVASDIILGELGSGGDRRISKKRKLTRPERKAQEREKKKLGGKIPITANITTPQGLQSFEERFRLEKGGMTCTLTQYLV